MANEQNTVPMGPDIEALKSQHGDVWRARTDEAGDFYYRRNTAAEYQRFVDEINSQTKSNSAAMLSVVLSAVVYPPTSELRNILNKYPGLTLLLAGKIQEANGTGMELDVSKV